MDKQLTIQAGNKLIAEFMGLKIGNAWQVWNSMADYSKDADFEYHSSWDWLMPACHKWDRLTDAEIKEGTWPEYERLCDLLDTKVALYEIQPVWNQLVENLQWYNSIN